MPVHKERLSVLLQTEGTYPYSGGGVSTWCDALCRELPGVDFYVVAVTGDTNVTLRYELPRNVRALIHVPLWGAEEPTDYINTDQPFADVYLRKQSTTEEAVTREFIPALREFLRAMENEEADLWNVARAVTAMYDFVQRYDYTAALRSRPAWRAFLEESHRAYAAAKSDYPADNGPSAYDFTTALRWLGHYLMVLNLPVPRVDVAHASISASAALAGIVAKIRYGTPFLLTEHGVFIRERAIAVSQTGLSFYLKRFLIKLSALFSRLSFALADQVSPVCDFNRRWELLYGAREEQLQTIYNGINPAVFVPRDKPPANRNVPTVVAAARVYPLKDILTMIQSARIVREEIPDVRYVVYGSLSADPGYVSQCRALIAKLNLEETFKLAGFHARPAEIYNEGDLSMLSSVSEGFPYTVIESMACARPVVATDVGGVSEALQGHGVIVRPRDPAALAEGAITLLRNDGLRSYLGRKAREAVLTRYRTDHSVQAYLQTYRRLAEATASR